MARACASDVTSRVYKRGALVCVECGTQECRWYCSSDADGGYVTVDILHYDLSVSCCCSTVTNKLQYIKGVSHL